MLTQLQRKTLLTVADDILEAVIAQKDSLEFLLAAYRLSNMTFSGRENDPDPTTILMGVQAAALGVLTLTRWLEACGTVLGTRYYNEAQDLLQSLTTTLDRYGIVLPDQVPL
jgi:hypothetical protein